MDNTIKLTSMTAFLSERHVGLNGWWQRHNKEFSLWYLALDKDAQRETLLNCCPDMPQQTAATRELYTGQDITPSDMLIPELTQEALLSNQGKLLVLLITRRLVNQDGCIISDAKFLESKFSQGVLPRFPDIEHNFSGMDTPFVDPTDTSEMIHCLDPATTPAMREKVMRLIQEGILIRAQTWIALKIRRTALENFIYAIFSACEENVSPKLAPSLESLIEAEAQQRQYSEAMCLNSSDSLSDAATET